MTLDVKIPCKTADSKNEMLGLFFYIAGCAFVSIVLTFIYSMFRSVQARDEYKSWKVMVIFFAIVMVGPYAYNDVLTRRAGPELKDAVLAGLTDAGIEGELAYFRVVKSQGDTCRIVAVVTENQSWGGTERPVVAITAKKDAKGWISDTYIVVNSVSRNADSYTFPPYY